jgi:hypothetical protein
MMDEQDKAYLDGMVSRIAKHGYTLVGVFDPEGKDPPYVYSVGLTQRGWPEVILVTACMRPQTIETLLADLLAQWFHAEKVVMGDNPDLLFMRDGSSHALRVVDVDNNDVILNDYAGQVGIFFEEDDVKFVQVLWPDKSGKFPDEEGYSTEPSMIQPILGK